MEFLTKKRAADECGPANAITKSQIRSMLKLASICRNDIFYDLGSGHGKIIRMIVKERNPEQAIGIENDVYRFWRSVMNAKRYLSKKELSKIYFWCIDMDYAELSDASIIYNGLEEDNNEINLYKNKFGKKGVKIIKKDLPLISYRPVAVNRDNPYCWFFLMKYPLHRYKTRDKNKWASYVLGRNNVSIRDVYDYYDKQMKKREIIPSERRMALNAVKRLVRERF